MEQCCYCGNEANFQFKNGKWCCKPKSTQCPSRIERIQKLRSQVNPETGLTKLQETFSSMKENLDENGLNHFQRAQLKSIEIRKTDIQDGKTNFERASEKMARTRKTIGSYKTGAEKATKTKFSTINKEGLNTFQSATKKAIITKSAVVDGLTGLQRAARKSVNTMKNDIIDGLNAYQRCHIDSVKRRKNDIDEHGCNDFQRSLKKSLHGRRLNIDATGENSLKRGAKKAIQTQLSDIDEHGINGVERRLQKAFSTSILFKTHNDILIRYQGNNEKLFLDSMIQENGVDWCRENIHRGPTVHYIFDNKPRLYFPDFLIGNTIFEIKSSYYWNRNGVDLTLQKKNETKLSTTKLLGYNVVLVLDGEYIPI